MEEDQEEPLISGPLGNKFMDIAETFSVLQGPYTILDEIPTTRKDGYNFILDNTTNEESRKNGKRSENCGAWNQGSTQVTVLMKIHGKPVSIVKTNGLYCSENKRAQRALGRSPKEKVKGQGKAIYRGPLMLSTKYW